MRKFTFKISRSTLLKLKKILKWSLVVTKLAAIGTALTGAVTAITSSMSTGFAITAAGATTYAAAKNIPAQGYDKTKHIPPVANKPTGNSKLQERLLMAKLQGKATKPNGNSSLPPSSKLQVAATRSDSKSMIVRKRT